NMSGYTTGAGNQLTGDGVYTYAYDNEGNLTSKTKTATGEHWTFGYDNANELTSVTDKSSTKRPPDAGNLRLRCFRPANLKGCVDVEHRHRRHALWLRQRQRLGGPEQQQSAAVPSLLPRWGRSSLCPD